MEETINNSNAKMQTVYIIIGFILICIRSYFTHLLPNTIILTFLINLFLLASIDYRRISNSLFVILPFIFYIPFNFQALGFVDILLYSYLLRNYKIKHLAGISLITAIISLILTTYLVGLGAIENETEVARKGLTISNGGYNNPNTLGQIGYSIILTIYFICKRRNNLILLFTYSIISYIFFYYSGSRTYLLGTFVLILLGLFLKMKLPLKKCRFLFSILPIIFCLCILYILHDISLSDYLDIFASGRFGLYRFNIERMRIINWIVGLPPVEDLPMDGSFLNLLFSGGIFALCIFCFLFYKKIQNWDAITKEYFPALISIIICGLAENTFSSPTSISILFWLILIKDKTHHRINQLKSHNTVCLN